MSLHVGIARAALSIAAVLVRLARDIFEAKVGEPFVTEISADLDRAIAADEALSTGGKSRP